MIIDVDEEKPSKSTCSKILTIINITIKLVIIGVNVALIVIGAQSLDICPLQTMIPIWMIVSGK